MKVLTISGSNRESSKTIHLLNYLPKLNIPTNFEFFPINNLPLFQADLDKNPLPQEVQRFRNLVAEVDALIIATPEYIHNIPACLKSALEWLTTSGELEAKPILAITYTPYEPRGEKAMQSLLWTLGALNAKVVTSLALYHGEVSFNESGAIVNKAGLEIVEEAISLLG